MNLPSRRLPSLIYLRLLNQLRMLPQPRPQNMWLRGEPRRSLLKSFASQYTVTFAVLRCLLSCFSSGVRVPAMLVVAEVLGDVHSIPASPLKKLLR